MRSDPTGRSHLAGAQSTITGFAALLPQKPCPHLVKNAELVWRCLSEGALCARLSNRASDDYSTPKRSSLTAFFRTCRSDSAHADNCTRHARPAPVASALVCATLREQLADVAPGRSETACPTSPRRWRQAGTVLSPGAIAAPEAPTLTITCQFWRANCRRTSLGFLGEIDWRVARHSASQRKARKSMKKW